MRSILQPRAAGSLGHALRAAAGSTFLLAAIACNVQFRGVAAGGPGNTEPRAPAACAGAVCHFGEYCDPAENVCKPGCLTDATCGPIEACSKAAGQTVGTCQERTDPPEPVAPAPAEGPATPTPQAACASTKPCSITPDCGANNHCSGGGCYENRPGCACDITPDCGPSGHCTGGMCYANEPGVPCSITPDCGPSGHCTGGMCYANQPGVPCSITPDCGPNGHCTGGTCHENKSGSPCEITPDCGPGSACVGGTCN